MYVGSRLLSAITGNMTRGRATGGVVQRYEYDEAGRLVKVKTDAGVLLEEYGYGRNRERIKKTKQDGSKVYYAWGGSSVLAEYEEGASATVLSWTKSYVYAGSRLLSTITKTGSTETTEYHHPDRLGTKLVTTGTTAKEQSTLPYGTVITSETTANSNQKFTSYDRSDKTGLDYAVNRIYSSEQGRFTQPDPIGMASVDLTDPQTLNLYTYARNNPIDFVDPSGTHSHNIRYFLDGIEVPARMALRALASGSAELPRGYSGPLGHWVDFDDWSKTDEYGFPGTGTTFVSNTLYIQGLLDRTGPSSPVRSTREGFGGGGYSGEDYNLSNSVRESTGTQPKSRGDWRVKALVRGGAPTAEAARPVLNVIATVMGFFTSPFVSAAGSGVSVRIGQGTARGSAKLLPQFSKSTIDDAVLLTMNQKGPHLFANKLHPKPWLNNLAKQMGGERNVINAALQNANGRIIPNARGIFNTPVNVGGVNFTIRGFVNQGKPIINSIFIP